MSFAGRARQDSEGTRIATTRDKEIEAEARAILRETIQCSGWYQNLRGVDREKLIAQAIERHWHLIIADAVKPLEQGRDG